MTEEVDAKKLADLIKIEVEVTSPDVDDDELAGIVLRFGDLEWEMLKAQILRRMSSQLGSDS